MRAEAEVAVTVLLDRLLRLRLSRPDDAVGVGVSPWVWGRGLHVQVGEVAWLPCRGGGAARAGVSTLRVRWD